MPPEDPPTPQRISLARLQWIAVVAPIAFVALLEYAVWRLYPALLSWPGRFVIAGAAIVFFVFIYGAVFSIVRGMQERLARQNRELLALHHASLDIYGELALDVILQKVVDQARALVDARYGAVSVTSPDSEIQQFVTSGLDDEARRRIGELPKGHGLLGIVPHEQRRLRVADIARDPRAAGFPPGHPAMRSLLAVPIPCKGPFRGNLYVADKLARGEFSGDDEDTLVRFATQAAIAIDNANLNERLRCLAVAEERARIAREMHDGMAQVLASVNTKAQAIRQFMRRGKIEEAGIQLEQLAAAAREVYADVREGILALRIAPEADRPLIEALPEFVSRWREFSGIAVDLRMDPAISLSESAELQLLRILQEALANVRKHARAERVEVALWREDAEVLAIVSDQGVGFDPAAAAEREGDHYGLRIMQERARSVGGRVGVVSEPGAGTRVEVAIPALATAQEGP